MKRIVFIGLLSFLVLAGGALAQQSEERKQGSSMQGMMQQMMKGEKSGESGMGGMMGMMNMMGQMSKMMDQCTAMMGSGETETQKAQ